MSTATINEPRTNVRRRSAALNVRQQTFKEWLAAEASGGRMILAVENDGGQLPPPPHGTIDFWAVHNETRTDRF